MLTLADIRDYIATTNITMDENVYCYKLDSKKDKSIGIYSLDQNRTPNIPVGGAENSSYNTKGISLLIHWNKSPRNTEVTAQQLYNILLSTKNVEINEKKILFVEHLYNEPISVNTDDKGIYEYVIECFFYYKR